MQKAKVFLVYFSPTGNTQASLRNIAGGLLQELKTYSLTEYDLTLPEARKKQYQFGPNDLIVLGMPTYMGRLPLNSHEFFSVLEAEDTPASLVVTYGNREYEDALLELAQKAEERGFKTLAAATFICTHAYSERLSGIRPDKGDLEQMKYFGMKTAAKLHKGCEGGLTLNSSRPYKKTGLKPVIPQINREYCIKCMVCVEGCPTGALSLDDNQMSMDHSKCLTCCRCVNNCPTGARHFDPQALKALIDRLTPLCADRKEPELFF